MHPRRLNLQKYRAKTVVVARLRRLSVVKTFKVTGAHIGVWFQLRTHRPVESKDTRKYYEKRQAELVNEGIEPAQRVREAGTNSVQKRTQIDSWNKNLVDI